MKFSISLNTEKKELVIFGRWVGREKRGGKCSEGSSRDISRDEKQTVHSLDGSPWAGTDAFSVRKAKQNHLLVNKITLC